MGVFQIGGLGILGEFTHQGSRKDRYVREMFNDIAPRYDFLNRVLSLGIDRYWRSRLVAALQLPENALVLDIATGTGDVAVEIIRRTSARVIGLDVAYNMLKLAQKKTAVYPKTRFQPILGDAQLLPLDDECADAITIAFGFRNIGHYQQALSEFHRVLKPGGQLAILEFSIPGSRLFNRIYQIYFKAVLPRIAGVFSRSDAYRYLPESVSYFPSREKLKSQFSKAGFSNFQYSDLSLGIASIFQAVK